MAARPGGAGPPSADARGGPDCSLLPRGAPPATLHAGVSWDRDILGSRAEADGSQSTRGQGRVTVGAPAMPTPPLH